jgi:hypothetical protein
MSRWLRNAWLLPVSCLLLAACTTTVSGHGMGPRNISSSTSAGLTGPTTTAPGPQVPLLTAQCVAAVIVVTDSGDSVFYPAGSAVPQKLAPLPPDTSWP